MNKDNLILSLLKLAGRMWLGTIPSLEVAGGEKENADLGKPIWQK